MPVSVLLLTYKSGRTSLSPVTRNGKATYYTEHSMHKSDVNSPEKLESSCCGDKANNRRPVKICWSTPLES